MQLLVEGVGAVGARAGRQAIESGRFDHLLLTGGSGARAQAAATSFGSVASVLREDRPPPEVSVVVLAGPPGTHLGAARRHLSQGRAVVSTSDDLDEVRGLLDLGAEAAARGVPVVVGAGFAPGLSCLLARRAARDLDEVTEVHVARAGSGGPACERHRVRSLAGRSLEWHDHAWRRRSGGGGRQLGWFPDPVGGRDCYRAALPDPLLLVPAFPGVQRVTSRLAATSLDRLRSRLPLPVRVAPDDPLGALRVEVRGRRGGVAETVVLGALDRPAVAAGAAAGLVAVAAASGEIPAGAAGLGAVPGADALLAGLAAVGVKPAVFTGATG